MWSRISSGPGRRPPATASSGPCIARRSPLEEWLAFFQKNAGGDVSSGARWALNVQFVELRFGSSPDNLPRTVEHIDERIRRANDDYRRWLKEAHRRDDERRRGEITDLKGRFKNRRPSRAEGVLLTHEFAIGLPPSCEMDTAISCVRPISGSSTSTRILRIVCGLTGAPGRHLVQILVQGANLLALVLEVHAHQIADREQTVAADDRQVADVSLVHRAHG